MITGNLVLWLVASFAVLTTLLGMLALVWKTRRRPPAGDFAPAMTIFKPLKGIDEGLEANLRGFFLLDYPEVQLLFGVAEGNDPAIGVVEKLLREFPESDAHLVVGAPAFGLNPKVENLAALNRLRKHDYILISDSNVRVRPSYLRETVRDLSDPAVGLVSNIFAGVDEASFGAAMENLQLNGFVSAGVSLASMVGATCVVGKSMMMPVRVLDAIGGFASVRNLLAEDQAIGIKVRKAGFAVKLSRHVIDNVNQARGFRWFLNRHSRWYKIRRRMAPPAFFVEPFTNLTAVGLVWALSDDTGVAWGGLLVLAGLSVARDAFQTYWLRGTFPKARHLLLCPVKDLVLLPVWLDAMFNNRVMWRGHRLLVGHFTRLRLARAPLKVRRRVRRMPKLRTRSLDRRRPDPSRDADRDHRAEFPE
ncbi:MAG: ceramide glucosyltransferase [Isosphaeraceae bacterium]